jgi:hypothetical protein
MLVPVFLITPLHLCGSTWDLVSSIINLLSPIFLRHLRILCLEPGGYDSPNIEYKPASLITVYLVAPILSIGVAVASWVSASFWIFAILMGNPDGTEKRDDGRATVLGVRNRWGRFLLSAVR